METDVIERELARRRLPPLRRFSDGGGPVERSGWRRRREELLELLRREVYGSPPPPPPRVRATVRESEEAAFAGKAEHSLIELAFDTPRGEFSFPVELVLPRTQAPPPLFLHIAFRRSVPDRYYPAEEIADAGFAVATFGYEEVAPDLDDGLRGALAGCYATGARAPEDWGKISLWAWAAQRVMDYLQTLERIDRERIAVVGHSRLGKTALWCAAQDERFAAAFANESGCAGAALGRGKRGERIRDITDRFGYWFCENYRAYRDREEEAPFDQHFLLAALAPRPLYVASAAEDAWSDPESEFLACAAASEAYELLGGEGLVAGKRFPQPGERYHSGSIGYHLRPGTHFLSREDWQQFIAYHSARLPGG